MRRSSFLKIYRRGERFWVLSLISKRLYQLSSSWIEIKKEVSGKAIHQGRSALSDLLTSATGYEEEVIDFFHRKAKAYADKLCLYFTVTSRCDLKCQYCFENHLKRRDAEPGDIKLFTRLLKKNLSNNKEIRKVEFTLFGGEPLLRVDICRLLLTSVRNVCLELGLEYRFAMASNGVIAEKHELDDLKKCGLTDIQITFDGWKASHDRVRKVNGKGYLNLLDNVSWLEKTFNLILKYNIRKQNVSDFVRFIDDVKKLKLRKITVKLEALQPTLTDTNNAFYFLPNDPKLAKVYLGLANIAAQKGLRVDISSATKPPCMASAPNSFMIGPDGDISACISAYKVPRLLLGNIKEVKGPRSFFFDRDAIRESILKAVRKKCGPERCPYFPVCETGCLFVKETLKMSYGLPYCRKRYFDQLIPGLIKIMAVRTDVE